MTSIWQFGKNYDQLAAEYARHLFDELRHKPLDQQLLDRSNASHTRKWNTKAEEPTFLLVSQLPNICGLKSTRMATYPLVRAAASG